MAYFLLKTDPQTYSIEDLAKEGRTRWDGVHSFAAIRYIKEMKPGDKALIYHSQGEASIVGLAEIVSEPYPNTDDPRTSWVVDIQFKKKFDTKITLAAIKAVKEFAALPLVRQGRLSVMSIPDDFVLWLRQQKVMV